MNEPAPTLLEMKLLETQLDGYYTRIKELESKLEQAEKDVLEAENDARQWGKQLDQQVRVNRDDKAKLKEIESRLGEAEKHLRAAANCLGHAPVTKEGIENFLGAGVVESRPQLDAEKIKDALSRIGKPVAVETFFSTAAAAMEGNEPSYGLPITATLVERQS